MPVMTQDPVLDNVLVRASRSLAVHCRLFHGKRFSRVFSPGHAELFKLLDSPDLPQQILITAHRGFGKSSIINLGLPSQSIMFEKARFILPVSATATLAELQSENLKNGLTGSNEISSIIGDIKHPDNPFSKEMWKTANGVKVLPRGAEQQVRGLIIDDDRPDLLIVDDLEKSEQARSPEQRKKVKEWFFSDLINCVDRGSKNYRIVVIGTIIHEDSLLEDLKNDKEWTHIDFPICDMEGEEFISRWPEYMSNEDCKKLYTGFKARGELGIFYREFMNEAAPAEDAVYKQEMFKPYNEGDIDLNRVAENFVILDPAKTAKVHSAFTAIAGIGVHWETHRVYVRDLVNKRLYPDQIYTELFDMADRINAKVIGIEVTSLSEFIMQPLRNEMLRRGKHYELVELQARKGEGDYAERGKDGRIAAMAPYYRLGQVYHNPTCCNVLEAQLLAFPFSKFKDASDAVSYFVEMLEKGGRYFEGWAGTAEELDGTPEDVYKQLEEDNMEPLPYMSTLEYV